MPLDHVKGEIIEEMDAVFIVSPLSKWASQSRLTTEVEEVQGKKFKRKVMVTRPIWQVALSYAKMAFVHAGAQPGSDLAYDCIVQEYPRTDIVCFLFNATVNGQEMYFTAPFKLGKDQIADLTLRNLWRPYTLN